MIEMEERNCPLCGDEMYFQGCYNCGPEDLENCEVCEGDGGWWNCLNFRCGREDRFKALDIEAVEEV